jgi:hypothetical protein
MSRAIILSLSLVVLSGGLRDAAAQTSGRFDVSAGGLWIGHQALGSNDAGETTPSGTTLKVFTASSDLASAAAAGARVAVRAWRSLDVEVEASYARPRLRIAISNDIENAPAVTAVETLQQLSVGAGVVWHVPYRLWTPRLVPFVIGGGGYLRQLHENGTLLETGRFYQVGGGMKVVLFSRARGFINAAGARLDVRAFVRSGGVAFDDRGHTSPALGASAFVRF